MPTVTVYDGVTPDLQRIADQLQRPRGLLVAVGGELRSAHMDHWTGRGAFYQTEIARYLSAPVATDTTVEITVGGTGGPILLHKIAGGTVFPKTTKMLAIPANPEARKLGWPRHWSKPGDGQMEVVFGRGGVPVALALVKINEKRLRNRLGITQTLRGRRREIAREMKSAAKWMRDRKLKGQAKSSLTREVRAAAIKKAREGGTRTATWTGRIMYFLKKSVTHRPDPLALPDRAAVETRIVKAGEAYLAGVLAGHYARNAPRSPAA